MVDRCICCGEIVPEGRQVCPKCYGKRKYKIIEVDKSIKELVDQNNGYCPCTVVKNEYTKCMCKEFKEQESGLCHCGRFEKVVE